MSRVLKVVIAEDHEIVRMGLKTLISKIPIVEVVGEAADGLKAVQLVESLKPDILVLDLSLPRLHGLEVLSQIKQYKTTKTIVISLHSNECFLFEAFRHGAAAYILKSNPATELGNAFEAIANGTHYVSPSLEALFLEWTRKEPPTAKTGLGVLTQRERTILEISATGKSSLEIARELSISPRTVELHRKNLLSKLSLKNQTDLVRFAIRNRLIAP